MKKTRRYRIELAGPDGETVVDEVEEASFVDAVESAKEFRTQERIGTRIVSVIEQEAYDELIAAIHRR